MDVQVQLHHVNGISCFEWAAHAEIPLKLGTETGWTYLSADSKELLEEIKDKQAEIVRLQVEKETAVLRKEELEALLEDVNVPQKHRTHSRDWAGAVEP